MSSDNVIDLKNSKVTTPRHDEVTPDKNSKSKSTKSSRKKKRRHSSTDDEECDSYIDMKLKQSAKRNNLTPQNVKNILQKVVKNDHVLAIVKLKEEELERQEQAQKSLNSSTEVQSSSFEVSEHYGTTDGHVPKLTRAKAKQLNKYPLPVPPLKHSKPASEVVALIQEELHSDDDDEEYQPGEDDIESDDDINTTTSDIDSQPATPSSQVDALEEPSETVYTQDGLFKIPRTRNDSTHAQDQEYIIAQRTRSKISLAETPIETIESNFWAPDVTLDMYHVDPDENQDWKQFLNNLQLPPITAIENEKDEETDPDYLPADNLPDDREEFQQSTVPRKEVNDLLSELFDLPSNFLDFNYVSDMLTIDTNAQNKPALEMQDLDQSLVTPIKEMDAALKTPNNNSGIIEEMQNSPITSNTSVHYFDPNVASTPARPLGEVSIPSDNELQQSTNLSNTLVASTDSNSQYSYPYLTNSFMYNSSQDKSSIFVPFIKLAANTPQNDVSVPNTPIVVSFPSNLVMTPYSNQTTAINPEVVRLAQQLEGGPVPKRPGCRSKAVRFRNFKELENLTPSQVKAKVFHSVDERGFTLEQRGILEKQLRIHVQMATQSYIQTYGHPEFYSEAYKLKRFLTDLKEIVDRENANPVYIHNLEAALKLIHDWENELSQDTPENTELYKHLTDEMDKLRRNMSYTMPFHKRILKIISESKVFIYPELLPAVPFRFKTVKPSEYMPAEDYLISFLLEHYFEELQHKMKNYKLAKPKEVNLTTVCKYISAHLGYIRPWKSVYDYVRLRRSNDTINPIKFYFQHSQSPPIHHRPDIFNPNCVVEPAKQPLKVLPYQWAKYVEKLIGFSHDVLINEMNVSAVAEEAKSEQDLPKITYTAEPLNESHLQTNQANNDVVVEPVKIHVKIVYEIDEVKTNSTNQCGNSKLHENTVAANNTLCEPLLEGQTLLTSFFKPVPKHTENVSLDYEFDISLNIDTSQNDLTISSADKKSLFQHSRRIRKKYKLLFFAKYLLRHQATKFLVHLIAVIRDRNSQLQYQLCHNRNVLIVHRCIVSYQQYTKELLALINETAEHRSKMSSESLIINRRIQKLLNDNSVNQNDENLPAQHQNDGGVKRLPKNQRTGDNVRLLLFDEKAQESSEKDFLFAQRFMDRVEETFINENVHHKFTEFLSILQNFSENHQQSGTNSPQLSGADLYLILEKFFLPDYPDLADLFLYFLLPRDAVEINKSMEYFLKVNLTKFYNKLTIFYQKQPAQIRKVFACLKELSDDPDVTIERLRSKMLPLLKGNQLLIEWFLQCVGPDKCESSKDEYETLVLRKGNESFDDDQFEYIPQSEILADPNDNPCHIRFMNGRLFYGNRYPLPAKLSFSAIPCSSVDSPEDDKQMCSASKSQSHYHCVHNIKEFADNKMRDRHHCDAEHVNVVGPAEEIENSDEEQCSPIEKLDNIDEDAEIMSPTNVLINTSPVLCDNTLLKAHSVRLNPSSHVSLVHSNAELLNKLKSQEHSSVDVKQELRLSPKKQNSIKLVTSAIPKTSQTGKVKSPNTKKVQQIGCKSPKKTTSPVSPSLENVEAAYTSQIAQPSQAIQTAKKLKKMLETHDGSSTPAAEADGLSKRGSRKSHMLSKPIKKQKRAHEYYMPCDEDESIDESVDQNKETEADNDLPKEKIEIQWTREEDRLLLEQIKAGLDSNIESITGFAHQFPNKTPENIKERIDFLIDFLTKLRNK